MEISKIRLLRSDVKVWLVYAGSQRRHFETFRQASRVFLNLPGFDANLETFGSEKTIRQHLAMSDAISAFIRGATSVAPSRNPANYSAYPQEAKSPAARSFSAEVGNILRLFVEAKPGDLVLSPSLGHFEPLLIGEIESEWSKNDDLEVTKLFGEIVPTRKVKWQNVALARRDFRVKTARHLQNRHAITLLDSDFYSDIFDRVYPSYAWQGRSKLDLFGDGYKGKDPLQPFLAAKLLKYVISSAFAFTDGRIVDFQSLSIDEAIQRYYDEKLIDDLTLNFNSPGKFTVISRRNALAALLASGLLIATGAVVDGFEEQKTRAAHQVGDAVSGEDKDQVTTEVGNYLQSLDSVKWKQVQSELGGPANQSLNISLDNRVEVATHRAELDAR